MTKAMKLRVHLEYVIFDDLPEGTRLDAIELNALCDAASENQKRRAFNRALIKSPVLLADEIWELPTGLIGIDMGDTR